MPPSLFLVFPWLFFPRAERLFLNLLPAKEDNGRFLGPNIRLVGQKPCPEILNFIDSLFYTWPGE